MTTTTCTNCGRPLKSEDGACYNCDAANATNAKGNSRLRDMLDLLESATYLCGVHSDQPCGCNGQHASKLRSHIRRQMLDMNKRGEFQGD